MKGRMMSSEVGVSGTWCAESSPSFGAVSPPDVRRRRAATAAPPPARRCRTRSTARWTARHRARRRPSSGFRFDRSDDATGLRAEVVATGTLRVTVNAPGVAVRGLTVTMSGPDLQSEDSGIFLARTASARG